MPSDVTDNDPQVEMEKGEFTDTSFLLLYVLNTCILHTDVPLC